MAIFTECEKKILEPGQKYVNHGLNIDSYLESIFTKKLIKQIGKYKIILIKGDLISAINYLSEVPDLVILDFPNERPCFEKTLYSKIEKTIFICNLNSDERINHYILLLQAASDIFNVKIFYSILKNNNNDFLDNINLELSNLKGKIDKCVIGYGSEFEKILLKKYGLPTKKIRNNFFSYRYYENIRTIFVGHVFGWNSYLIVSILKKIGVKKFAYIGNCGGLGHLKIGTIVVPKIAIKVNEIDTINLNQNLHIHLSVSSPIIETEEFIRKIEKLGILTIDVEYTDLFRTIGKYKFYGYLIVSDLPGKIHKNNARISDIKLFRIGLMKVVKIISKEFFNE